jgi:DNL zinc finger
MIVRSAAFLLVAVDMAFQGTLITGIFCDAFLPGPVINALRKEPKVKRDTFFANLSRGDEDIDENIDLGIPQLPALGAAGSSSIPQAEESVPRSSPVNVQTSNSVSPLNNSTSTTAFVSPKFELQYTCNVCETRNRVIVNRMAYQKGMVIAICKGCDAKHWIADNLDPALTSNNIEELFASRSDEERVSRVTQEVYDIERVWEFKAGEMTDSQGNPVLE